MIFQNKEMCANSVVWYFGHFARPYNQCFFFFSLLQTLHWPEWRFLRELKTKVWCEIASRVLAQGQNVLAHGHNVLAHRRHACTQAQRATFAQCAPLQNDHVQHTRLYTWLYTFVTLHLLHLAFAEWSGGSAGCGLDRQVPRPTCFQEEVGWGP